MTEWQYARMARADEYLNRKPADCLNLAELMISGCFDNCLPMELNAPAGSGVPGQTGHAAPFQDVQRIYHPVASHVEHPVQTLRYHPFYRSCEVMLMEELERKAALPVGGNSRQQQLISGGTRVIGAD